MASTVNWDRVIDSGTILVFDTQRECERFRRETEHDDRKLDERLVQKGWKPISPYRRAASPTPSTRAGRRRDDPRRLGVGDDAVAGGAAGGVEDFAEDEG